MTNRFDATPASTLVDPWRRQNDFLVALGLKGETFDLSNAAGSTTIATQVIKGTGRYFYTGEVITTLYVCVAVAAAGTAPTLLKLGVWSAAATPACLAVTADLSADSSWTSVGIKGFNLASVYTVTSDAQLYLAELINGTFGTTQPQLNSGAATSGQSVPIGSNRRRNATLGTGQTDMTVAATGAYTAAAAPIWFGWA